MTRQVAERLRQNTGVSRKPCPPIGQVTTPVNRGFGSGGRDRTYDQLINSQLLYR